MWADSKSFFSANKHKDIHSKTTFTLFNFFRNFFLHFSEMLQRFVIEASPPFHSDSTILRAENMRKLKEEGMNPKFLRVSAKVK